MMIMRYGSNKKIVCKAFTLIELLAVVIIISILGGLAVGGYVAAMGAAKEAKTKTSIKAMATALEAVKAKKGFYPQVVKGTGEDESMLNNVCWVAIEKVDVNDIPDPSTLVCTLAFKPPIKSSTPTVLDPYVNKVLSEEFVKIVDLTDFVKANCGFVVANGYRRYYLKDGWGNPIFYNSPGFYNTMSFDLISTGVDGFPGDPKGKKSATDKLFYVDTDKITVPTKFNDPTDVDLYKSEDNSGEGLGTVDDIVNN